MKKSKDELDRRCHGIHAQRIYKPIMVDVVYIVDDMISAMSIHSEEIISSVSYSWYDIQDKFMFIIFLICSVISVSVNSIYDF